MLAGPAQLPQQEVPPLNFPQDVKAESLDEFFVLVDGSYSQPLQPLQQKSPMLSSCTGQQQYAMVPDSLAVAPVVAPEVVTLADDEIQMLLSGDMDQTLNDFLAMQSQPGHVTTGDSPPGFSMNDVEPLIAEIERSLKEDEPPLSATCGLSFMDDPGADWLTDPFGPELLLQI